MRKWCLSLFVAAACSMAVVAQEPPSEPKPEKPATAPAPAPAPAPAAKPPATPAATANTRVVKKAQILCEGKVKTDGAVTLVFAPQGGAASQVSVTLQKGMKQVDVCRDVAKELSVKLGANYAVKGEGAVVKIETKNKAPMFNVSQGDLTATGVSFAIKLK